jgi:predicted nucleic acid-binding protein
LRRSETQNNDAKVVFDNSIFRLTLHPDAKPRSGVDRVKDRVRFLVETLRDNRETVIIPAPVLSEFLVFAGKDAPSYPLKIRESSVLRIEPFDERAAVELADMEITARSRGEKRGSASGSQWQKVKFDRQIVAIAKVHGASAIYSDDPDIAAHGKDSGVSVLGSADLPLPPAQQKTIEEMLSEQTVEADQPIPTQLSGSDSGHSEGQAGTEADKKT